MFPPGLRQATDDTATNGITDRSQHDGDQFGGLLRDTIVPSRRFTVFDYYALAGGVLVLQSIARRELPSRATPPRLLHGRALD